MKILLLSPHADDIELGAGGTLARLLGEGKHEFFWVVFAMRSSLMDDAGWRTNRLTEASVEDIPGSETRAEFDAVASKLGIRSLVLSLPSANLPDFRQEILEILEDVKMCFNPELVIAPSLNDTHQSHRAVVEEAVRVFKSDASILGFEAPRNNLAFFAQFLIRLTEEQMAIKWEMLLSYKSQFTVGRDAFSKEFIYSWARMRGMQCNSQYAEAFELIRGIVR